MKKLVFWFVLAGLMVILVTCSFFHDEPDVSVSEISFENTQETLEAQLKAFLQINRSSSAIVGAEQFTVIFEDGFIYEYESMSRKFDIPFFLFKLESKKEQTSGFAFASGDARIGDLLAVVEDGYVDFDNPFIQIFFANLDGYILETIDVYNNTILQRRALTTSRSVAESDVSVGPLMTTKWNQNSPYSDVINSIFKRDSTNGYLTGCVATAVAQIMAFHEYPESSTKTITGPLDPNCPKKELHKSLMIIFTCSCQIILPIVQYNWTQMKVPISDITPEGKKEIGILMYEIGANVNMEYGTSGSSANSKDVPKAMSAMGYNINPFILLYNFLMIRQSIDARRPVYVRGFSKEERKNHWADIFKWFTYTKYTEGHAWVIDGYRVFNGKQMVHCNLGWGGSCNGWYISGVFNTNNVPELTRSVASTYTPDNFQYEQEIIPFIYPNR
jgi:hypothetical protein